MQYQITDNGVLRIDDNAWVPNDIANRDWQDYQNWLLVKGNIPLPAAPAPVVPVPPTILDQIMAMSPADKKTMFTSLSAAVAAASKP